jgi:hypothetical protein
MVTAASKYGCCWPPLQLIDSSNERSRARTIGDKTVPFDRVLQQTFHLNLK